MNVLVIAPHPDDEAIGCGGTVLLHMERGDVVNAVFLTSGELGLKQLPCEQAWKIREAEARRSCKVLGIRPPEFLRLPDWMMGDDIEGAARKLQEALQKLQPDLIYLPHPAEWHPDHRATLPILRAALHNAKLETRQDSGDTPFAAPRLRGYEVWTPLAEFQHVENITSVMATKLRALRKHVSQVRGWEYVHAVRGLNAFRGAMAGRCRYAEVFQDLTGP
jgi:N-acetylglucosamine malate deacetylase 1